MLRRHIRSIYDGHCRRFAIRCAIRFLHSWPPAIRPMKAVFPRSGPHRPHCFSRRLAVLLIRLRARRLSPAPSNTIEVVAANPVVKQIVEWDEYTARLEAIEFVMILRPRRRLLAVDSLHRGRTWSSRAICCSSSIRVPYEAIVKQAEAAVRQAKAQEVEAKSALVRTRAQRKVAESQYVLEQQSYRRAESGTCQQQCDYAGRFRYSCGGFGKSEG